MIVRFHSTRPLVKDHKCTVTFLLSVGLRAAGTGAYRILQALCGSGASRIMACRFRMTRRERQPIAIVEERFPPPQRRGEWPRERPRHLLRRLVWPGPSSRRQHAGLSLTQPSGAILTNPHTICYVNSVVQSLAWTVKHSGHGLDYAYGCLARAFEKLLLPGRLCLLDELSWRPLLRSWPKPRGQQDAAEFLCHLLATSQPGAFRGTWQSRIQHGSGGSCRYQLMDQGGLHAPIILELY